MSTAGTRSSFFAQLSSGARLNFFLGVFFLFASFNIVYDLMQPKGLPWYLIGIWCVYSGMVAVGWAYAFSHRLAFLWVVIPASILIPMFFGSSFWFRPGVRWELLLESIISIALVIMGYIFFVVFISGEGAKTLRMATEIRLAQEIHSGLVPDVDLTTDRLEIFGISSPTTEVGGDLMDVCQRGDRTDIYVADVAGHGVPAGVMMGMIKSAIRMKLLENDSLQSLIVDLNAVVFQVQKPGMFATFACLQFEEGGRVGYCLAGHHPILHYKASLGTVTELENEQPPLGVVEDFPLTASQTEAGAGDTFAILTDGLTEVFNDRGEDYGEKRFKERFSSLANRPLAEIHQTIMSEVREYGPQDDDQTLILARVR